MSCLDDAGVLRAVTGELTGAELIALDGHLDGCATCRALVGAAGLALGSGRGAALTDELPPGARVGRYVIERRLGAGAMGVVYLARDPELARAVAIKLVRPERAADGDRLVREARALARVAHEHVVAIFDVGRHDGQVYVAMERVDGPTLATWAATASFDRRLAAVVAVARALAAVHAAGLVHRDVKPANILVGADGRVRLGDFGLAAAEPEAGARTDGAALHTASPGGTPAYMAPEVLAGAAATSRSDQWSLGVTAWEVLTGARPAAGDAARAPRGGGARARALRAVARALSPHPDQRHADVDAMARALSSRSRLPRLALAAAVALATAAILTVVATARRDHPLDRCADAAAALDATWGAQHHQRARAAPMVAAALDRYARRWRTARVLVCRAAAGGRDPMAAVRTECLAARAAGLAAVVTRLGEPGAWSIAIAELLDPAECATATGLALYAPVPTGRGAEVAMLVASTEAARVASAVDPEAALTSLTALAAAADQLGHRPTQATVQLAMAEVLRRLGRYDGADAAAERAALAAAAGHDDLTAARAWLVRVGVAGDRRDLKRAEGWLPHAASAVERAGQPAVLAAQVDNSRGLLALGQGRLDEAGAALERALAVRSTAAGDDVTVARTLSALGHLARLRGELVTARARHERALAIDRAQLGDQHEDVARDLHNLGGILRLLGELDGAERAYREALAIRTAALGAAHPDVALVHNSLGILALDRGQLAVAEHELTVARDVFTATGHLDRAVTLANLARVALARGDLATARTTIEQALALDREQLPPRHERLAANLLVALRVARAAGDRARARDLATAAAAALPSDRPDLAAELVELAELPPPSRSPPRPRPSTRDAGASRPGDAAVADTAAPDALPAATRGVYGSSQGWN